MKICLLVLALSFGMAASVGGGSLANRPCAEIQQEIDIKNTQLAALNIEIEISKANLVAIETAFLQVPFYRPDLALVITTRWAYWFNRWHAAQFAWHEKLAERSVLNAEFRESGC
jgi:hypothetical protein